MHPAWQPPPGDYLYFSTFCGSTAVLRRCANLPPIEKAISAATLRQGPVCYSKPFLSVRLASKCVHHNTFFTQNEGVRTLTMFRPLMLVSQDGELNAATVPASA
jgi:hypothetical protein